LIVHIDFTPAYFKDFTGKRYEALDHKSRNHAAVRYRVLEVNKITLFQCRELLADQKSFPII
jgi:hypothetical protein